MNKAIALTGSIILLVTTIIVAQNSQSCRVEVQLREAGRVPKSNADTLVELRSNQAVNVSTKIMNKGQVEDFTIKLDAVNVKVTDGLLSRDLNVPSGASRSINLNLQVGALKNPCEQRSRHLEVSIFSKEDSLHACGAAAITLFCSSSEPIAPDIATALPFRKDTTMRVISK